MSLYKNYKNYTNELQALLDQQSQERKELLAQHDNILPVVEAKVRELVLAKHHFWTDNMVKDLEIFLYDQIEVSDGRTWAYIEWEELE